VLSTKAAHPGNLYSIKDIHEVVSTYLEEDQREYVKTKHIAKNLDALGFKNKVRAAGGLRVMLAEDDVRHEFRQRRVDPFDEDTDWLDGKATYQSGATKPEEDEDDSPPPFWETEK
jgi:hypothetical protein